MNPSFNVLDNEWIPVIDLEGHSKLLGIRETLAQAQNLLEISIASPIEEYSVYRFLGLFLMDALRPEKRRTIREILRLGQFDMTQIELYISQCQKEGVSFCLFDPERPFLQSLYDSDLDGQVKSIAALDCTLPSGNNHTHFNHGCDHSVTPQKAVRLILSTYWFCTAQAQGYPSGVYGAPPYFGVIKGKNLFETLVNLLLPINSIGIPFDEPPVLWRRNKPVRQKEQIGTTSWLEGMLFPVRRIHLVPDEKGNVVGVYLSQGENYVNKDAWRDPYVTYRSNDDKVFPFRPHADTPIWRNFSDIIDIPGNHASQYLCSYSTIHDEECAQLTLYGVETSQASYLSVHRHDFSLPLKLATENQIDFLKKSVASSLELRKCLENAVSSIPSVTEATTTSSLQQYDKACEMRFWQLCESMVSVTIDIFAEFSYFCSDISVYAMDAFDSALNQVSLRASALSIAEKKRSYLYWKAMKLKEANL